MNTVWFVEVPQDEGCPEILWVTDNEIVADRLAKAYTKAHSVVYGRPPYDVPVVRGVQIASEDVARLYEEKIRQHDAAVTVVRECLDGMQSLARE